MNLLRPIVAVAAVVMLGMASWAVAQERERPFGGPPPPQGPGKVPLGPSRSAKQKPPLPTCVTPAGKCELDAAAAQGAPCSCPSSGGKAVSPGKVE